MAVTKKCALQCEHCFEWASLNKKDILSPDTISRMLSRIQDKGVSQVYFSGGEPLLKMNTLLQVLKGAKGTTDFWVLTSGYNLTAENAHALKDAGLTGVIISLDHYIPDEHNRFRGFKDAYFWVKEAVQNALASDLVVALSLCATREFISERNLMAYIELARKMGVSFVQVLEPKAVGHYAGQDVLLLPEHIRTLETFYHRINFTKDYAHYPIITYHGYYQRRFGCFSAGVKGMYVDTNGDMNACPFCHLKSGNVLDPDLDNNLNAMVSQGCPSYTH
jgi:MoaA/NifB/PqqE/SkfB family radical SAM enzyme